MKTTSRTKQQLLAENEKLRAKLKELQGNRGKTEGPFKGASEDAAGGKEPLDETYPKEMLVQKRTPEVTVEVEQRKQAKEGLRESEKELRHLSAQLLDSQEKERRQVAADLHDNIWQTLNTIRFDIESVLSLQALGNLTASNRSIERINSNIRNAIERIRTMQGDLWPPLLDDIGILTTVNWYCREFEKDHAGITVEKQIRCVGADHPVCGDGARHYRP